MQALPGSLGGNFLAPLESPRPQRSAFRGLLTQRMRLAATQAYVAARQKSLSRREQR